jgi:hypothetical protein
MLLDFCFSVPFRFHIILWTLWDYFKYSELSISSVFIHSFVIPTRIVNLFVFYSFVCDTELIIAEKSFPKSLGLLNVVGLASVCEYTHIPIRAHITILLCSEMSN